MSKSFVSQEEVAALLEGVTGASQTPIEAQAQLGELRNYDMSSQERIVRGRMPTMDVVNERFARNLRLGLFNFIRRIPAISIGTIAVQRFDAFLRELAVPTNFNVVAVRPLRGNALIVCEPSLIFGVIDTLYGGQGKFQTRIEGREFSATELRTIARLVKVITDEYRKAWTGIYPIELEYQRSETQPQFAGIATPGEIVVATSFQLEIGQITGAIHFCLPYATLEPIRDVLYSSTQGDVSGIESLKWMDAKSVADLLRSEHPQIVAAILVHLEFDQAADVLKLLPERQRNEVMLRIATMEGIQPTALKDLNEVLFQLLAGADKVRKSSLGGVKTAAEMINLMGSAIEGPVIEAIRSHDPDLAQKIMDKMFVFDDLSALDNKSIQMVLKEVASDTLIAALKGAQPELREKILSNMSSRAAETLREDMKSRGPMRLSEVGAQQKEVLKIVRRLADEGQIVLGGGGGGDAMV